jgi:hypothetical protein
MKAKSPLAALEGDTFVLISKMRSGIPARTIPRIAANLGLSQEKLFKKYGEGPHQCGREIVAN